jgi:predicted nucleic acid-binding protein
MSSSSVRVFVDANIFIYALGAPSAHQDACRAFLREVADGHIVAATSTLVIQEVVNHFIRRGRGADAAQAGEAVLDACTVVYPVNEMDCRRLFNLLSAGPYTRAADLMHVAVMQTAGIDTIMSADRDFDRFAGVTRLDPLVWFVAGR